MGRLYGLKPFVSPILLRFSLFWYNCHMIRSEWQFSWSLLYFLTCCTIPLHLLYYTSSPALLYILPHLLYYSSSPALLYFLTCSIILLTCSTILPHLLYPGARWLNGRVSDSGARGRGFETYRRRVVSLSKTLYCPKVLVNYQGSGGSVPTWLKNCWLGR